MNDKFELPKDFADKISHLRAEANYARAVGSMSLSTYNNVLNQLDALYVQAEKGEVDKLPDSIAEFPVQESLFNDLEG